MNVYTTSPTVLASRDDKPSMQKVGHLINHFYELNELLQQEKDLSPSNLRVASIIKKLSAQLRKHYCKEEIQQILNDQYIQSHLNSVREKLSDAEFLTELHDAYQISSSVNFTNVAICEAKDYNQLALLPNWHIYMELVSQELASLRCLPQHTRQLSDTALLRHTSLHSDKTLLQAKQLLHNNGIHLPLVFVGSGPLPLSPIILHCLTGGEVICLEINPKAYDISCTLLERIGLQDKVSVVLVDGAEFDYRDYKLIFIASLVKNKLAVLEQIKRTSVTATVAVRTAQGIKQLMYESIDETMLTKQGWSIRSRTSPNEELVINSTLLLVQESLL